MKELLYQDVMLEKIKRQGNIKELQYHANGGAVHLGQISPGCEKCYRGDTWHGGGVQLGAKCMSNCSVCYYNRNRGEQSQEEKNGIISDHFYYYLNGIKSKAFAYQSSGETLIYIDDLEKVMSIHRSMDADQGNQMYHHLYTNGILANDTVLERLKEGGVHELRFHFTASNSSEEVIKNMYRAAKMGFAITIEEPAYPPNRKQIFDLLPILEDVAGKHLDMVEVSLTEHNIPDIEKEYPEVEYYRDYLTHVYDQGLTYDVMEEVVEKGYNFSVMDCNSGTERFRGQKSRLAFDMKSLEGMSAPFPYDEPKKSKYWWYEKNQIELEKRIAAGTAFQIKKYVDNL